MNQNDARKQARRVTVIGFFWNAALAVVKFWVGIFAQSSALIADAVHSISDLASDIGVFISLKVADKPVDINHNYGHGKFETLATILIGLFLFAAGIGILWNSITILFNYFQGQVIPKPGSLALIALVLSIAVKEWLYHYTIRRGKSLHRQVLVVNAWHHRSDALSSVAVLIGVSGAIFLGERWVLLDPIAAALVSLVILRVAFKSGLDAINELTEVSLSEERRNEILDIVSQVPGVNTPHNLKTRTIGNTTAIDMHIKVDKNLGIVEAHDISSQVEEKLKQSFGQDTFISIHVEPLIPPSEMN
jgi:cation diffusion facilitator family transporter